MLEFLPIASASVTGFVERVNKVILNPLILLMFGVALCVFLYGVFQFIANSESEEGKAQGRQHIMWGIIGMFIMMAAFAIIRILVNTLGINYINTSGQHEPTVIQENLRTQ